MAAGDTFKVYAGDGVTSDFPIPFPYDDAATEVSVTRANGAVTYTFTNPALIHLTSPTVLAVGDTLTIKRITNTDTPKAVFKNGSGTTGNQLNGMVNQLLRAVQEIKDTLLKVIVVGVDNTLDALNLRIKNVADAQNANDAVNKSQLDAAVVAAGNVPTPGAGNVGKYLKATAAGAWSWITITASDVSGLGSLATKSTVAAADVAANTLTFAQFQRTGTAGQVWASTGAGSDPVYVGSMTLLASGAASAVATLDLALPAGYKRFFLYLDNCIPVTNNVSPNLRFSNDSGSTYKATNYSWAGNYNTTAATSGTYDSSTGGTVSILMTAAGVSNSAGASASYEIEIYPGSASVIPTFFGTSFSLVNGGGSNSKYDWSGNMNFTTAVTNVRVLFGSGNIATVTYALYGVI